MKLISTRRTFVRQEVLTKYIPICVLSTFFNSFLWEPAFHFFPFWSDRPWTCLPQNHFHTHQRALALISRMIRYSSFYLPQKSFILWVWQLSQKNLNLMHNKLQNTLFSNIHLFPGNNFVLWEILHRLNGSWISHTLH